MDITQVQASIAPLLEVLNNLVIEFNAKFFGGRLEPIVVTIERNLGTVHRAYGFYETAPLWSVTGEEEKLHQITITSDNLASRTGYEICGTLLHELTHAINNQDNIQDTSRGKTYHNKKFKSTAETHGIHIEYAERIGWSVTTLQEDTVKYLDSLSLFAELQEKLTLNKELAPTRRQHTRGHSIKYICPLCRTSVRATKEVNITCTDCGVEMIPMI